MLGRKPGRGSGRLSARLESPRKGGAVQAERPDARGAAGRGHHLSWNRHSGQFRRQGAQDGNSDLGFSEQIELTPSCEPPGAIASSWFYLSKIEGIYGLISHF